MHFEEGSTVAKESYWEPWRMLLEATPTGDNNIWAHIGRVTYIPGLVTPERGGRGYKEQDALL